MKKYPISLFLCQILLQADIQIYPIPAIFISEDIKSENFKNSISETKNDMSIGKNFFLSTTKESFKTMSEINKMNANKTFIAYLKIPRVSLYEVPKTKDRTDYYLPITATFSIANMKTGEILYSGAYTHYSVYEGLKSGIENQLQQQQYSDGFQTLTSDLIANAKDNFNPFSIETSVIGKYEDSYILNKGTDDGLVIGDKIESATGSELKVVYSSANYSVGSKVLGTIQDGETFTKTNTGSITSIKRPKVGLVENNEKYNGFAWETLKQFFTDKIGEKASFTILPLDKIFYDAQELAFAESKSGLSQEFRNKRVAPSTFLKLDIGNIHSWETPSDKDYAYFDNYAINSCAAMINKDGLISASTCEYETKNDIVYGDIKFANDASTEIVTKNSILKIAENFSNQIKSTIKEDTIAKVDNGILNLSSGNVFKAGENVNGYRNIGAIGDIKNILVPIAEVKISDQDPLGAKELLTSKLDQNDILMEEKLGSTSQAKILKFGNSVKMDGETLSDFDMMAPYIISSNSKYNFVAWNNLVDGIESTFSSNFGFEKNTKLIVPESNLTVVPRYQVSLKDKKCDDNVCTSTYNIYTDIRIYNGEHIKSNIVFKGGYETDISLKHSKNEKDKKKIDYELNSEAIKLLIKTAKDISIWKH